LRKIILLVLLCSLGWYGMGCGGGSTALAPPESHQPPPAPKSYDHPDQEMLEEALRGRHLGPKEVADLSDRLLAEGSSTFHNEQAMARLEILITKALQSEHKEASPRLLRNLGIIHYHQRKFTLARQELQRANEQFPRDGRTHFYLARLAMHQGMALERKGQKKKAKGQFKQAATELELARKLEASNPLYRQDLRALIQGEVPASAERKK
jgi:tetratricopeptide (TPR) repeat protein